MRTVITLIIAFAAAIFVQWIYQDPKTTTIIFSIFLMGGKIQDQISDLKDKNNLNL